MKCAYTIVKLDFNRNADGTWPEMKIGDGLRIVQIIDGPYATMDNEGYTRQFVFTALVEVPQ